MVGSACESVHDTDHTADTEKSVLAKSPPSTSPFHGPAYDQNLEQDSNFHEFPDGGTRAWLVAAGAAGILFCTLGYTNSAGVFQAYYMLNQLQDKTADDIAWISSLQSFLMFATGSIGGPLFDHFGARVIYPAAVLYVFAIMMTSLCKTYWQFILAQGIITGIADGLLMFPSMSAIPQYFHKKRGAAMGIAIAGSSLGGVVFPIALGKMLNDSTLSFGWSIRICGFFIIPVLVFSCLAIRARLPPRQIDFFMPSAFKLPLFDTLLAANFCLFIGMYTPLIFLPTFALTQGMSTALSSYIVAMLNGASIFGRVLPRILADKFGRLNLLFAAGLSTGILVFCWNKVTGTAGVIIFSIFFGFCSGAIISGGSVALTLCPPSPKDIGTFLGQGMAVASGAVLLGPPVTGAMLDRYGGFMQISVFGVAFPSWELHWSWLQNLSPRRACSGGSDGRKRPAWIVQQNGVDCHGRTWDREG